MKFEKQTYTQVPNSLFKIMGDMNECELKVVLLICRYTFGYHRDEVKLSTRRIAEEIGMNTASVEKGASMAVERGIIEKITEGNKTTIWRAVVSDSECDTQAIQNLTRGDSNNESLLGVKETLNKKDMVDFELSKLPQLTVRQAIEQYFRLNVRWGTKAANQFEEWAKGQELTSNQIQVAADVWKFDKRFNWQVPTLTLIYEKWPQLTEKLVEHTQTSARQIETLGDREL